MPHWFQNQFGGQGSKGKASFDRQLYAGESEMDEGGA